MKLFKKYTIVVGLFLMSTTIFSQCFTKVNAGYGHAVAKKPNGSLWCWGWGSWGQLNNGSGGLNESLPISFSSSLDWENVFAGKFATFAIKTNGTLWGCGGNSFGGLGINSTIENIYNLSQIGVANNWKEISANDYFTIGLRTDGTIWGTGQNDGYQMGNATCCANQLSFMQIGTATDWKTIDTSGNRVAFGLKNNGTLWGWGTNFGGLLGYSNISVLQVPTQLTTDTDWDKISLGLVHVLVLKTNGTLWSWGGNSYGETGLDPVLNGNSSVEPSQIAGNWSYVEAGTRTSFGIKSDGTLWVWGLINLGDLNVSGATLIANYIPTQVGTANNWQSISCGYRHSVALRTDGSLWSWGNNSQGQLGTGSTIASSTPTQVAVAGCSLGTDDFVSDATQLIVSPNPAGADLNLSYKGQSTVDTIVIYDLTGREVYHIVALGSASFQSSFTIGFLQSGSYIVSLKNASGDVTSKQFLKN